MKLIPSAVAAVIASLSFAMPSLAGSMADSEQLINLVEKTGTKVSINTNRYDQSCIGKAGYYSYTSETNDLLVVCSDQVNVDDPNEFWEVVSHEATHVMQACTGSTVFKEHMHPRIFRALGTKAPHYSKLIDTQYSGNHAIAEAEAFWIELQPPADVLGIFAIACGLDK